MIEVIEIYRYHKNPDLRKNFTKKRYFSNVFLLENYLVKIREYYNNKYEFYPRYRVI